MCPSLLCIGSFVTIILVSLLIKDKWNKDPNRDKKVFATILSVILLLGILFYFVNFIILAPEPYYGGIEATLYYNNDNNTTFEEIREFVVENFTDVRIRNSNLTFFFSHKLNNSKPIYYDKEIKGKIIFNRNIPDNNYNRIKIELELRNYNGDPEIDKKEIINDVVFIENIFYNLLGMPYSVEYDEMGGVWYT
jgi:hypothetical protein